MAVNNTAITKSDPLTLTGITAPLAVVEVDTDGDGFDDADTTASESGAFSIDVSLSHSSENHGLNPVQLRATTSSNSIGVTEIFSVHYALGSVVQFESSVGAFAVELLDDDASGTVDNFKNYFARYTDSIIHRSINGFVIQGGGFTVDVLGTVSAIDPDDPVVNEFNADNSNVRGTLSMALPGVTNGAELGTSQWFINVGDNSGLDAASHTVFGRVIGDGMEVVDRINNFETTNLAAQTEQPALNETPVRSTLDFETLSGTVSLSEGEDLVTGSGTSFLTDLSQMIDSVAGSTIRINGEQYTVAAIISDTLLLLDREAPADLTDIEIEREVAPNAASYVVFSAISEILNGGT